MRNLVLRFLLAAYSAAGISFASSLLRDYAVINFSDQGNIFFQSFYIVSIAAGFSINAITLGGRTLEKSALFTLFVLGMIIIFIMSRPESDSFYKESVLILILLMWIAGAQWSRQIIENGWIFAGKIREAISSIILAGLIIFLEFEIHVSFLMAVALGTIFSWRMWQLIKSKSTCSWSPVSSTIDIRKLLLNIILTNLATFSITYWAFIHTGEVGKIYEFDTSTMIRFSMYAYQILTIGSVVIVSRGIQFRTMSWRASWILLLASVILFLGSLFAPLQLAIVLTPFFAALMHFGMVLFLQKITKDD